RPDILHTICALSQFSSDPSQAHVRMVQNVFRYLAGTLNRGLTYCPSNNPSFAIYSDALYASSLSNRRSFTGITSFYSDNLISWASQKQQVVVLSSTEAEYIAVASAAQQLIWLHRLLKDLGHPHILKLYGDNISSLFLVRNPGLHRRSKHIDVRYHFIHERYEEGEIDLHHVNSEDNIADLLTKPLELARHNMLTGRITTNTTDRV